MFGRLSCDEKYPCQGLGEHAHFRTFGMAFLTLFRIATGDNWNGIMKDTLRDECDDADDCLENCCINQVSLLLKELTARVIGARKYSPL